MSKPATKPAPAAEPTAAPTPVDSAPAQETPKFKRVKTVTVPLHKLRAGDTLFCKPLKPIYKSKPLKNDKDSDNKEPPHMLDIVNLETGELEMVIVGASLLGIFEDEYPNSSYVGKGFEIVVGDQKASKGGGGKRYNTYSVFEIALPA